MPPIKRHTQDKTHGYSTSKKEEKPKMSVCSQCGKEIDEATDNRNALIASVGGSAREFVVCDECMPLIKQAIDEQAKCSNPAK